jgi:hypothetical protein
MTNKSTLTWLTTVLTLLHSSSLIVDANKKPHKKLGFLKHPFLKETKSTVMPNISGGASKTELLLGEEEAATESLDVYIPLSESPALHKNDAPLMRDISMLTDILLDVVEQEDPKIRDLYNEFLNYGKQRYVI